MVKLQLNYLSILMVLMFSQVSYGESVLFNQQYLNLGTHLSVSKDVDNIFNSSTVLEEQSFIRLTEQQPNFGYSTASFWLSTAFHSLATQHVFFEIANPRLDNIEFYFYQQGELIYQLSTGDQKPFSARPVAHHNFVFPLSLKANEYYSVLIKVKSRDNIFLPISLWTEAAFYKGQVYDFVVYALFYGILLAVVVVNLLLFIVLKDKSYLGLALFFICIGLVLFSLNGLASRFFWGDWVWWSKQSQTFLEGLAVVFGVLFTRLFLNTAYYSSRINQYLSLLALIAGLVSLMSLFADYSWCVMIMSNVVIIGPILIVIAALVCYSHQYRPARNFLIAWLFFLVGCLIHGLMLYQFLPSNFITQYGMHSGLIWFSVFLFFALVDRVSHLKQQKESALLEIIHQQNITLGYQQRMVNSVSRFVPAQFLRLLEKVDIMGAKDGGATLKNMFIMLADVRGFSFLPTSMTAEESADFLNAYSKFMRPIVDKNKGFIDESINQDIMALFPDAADQAVHAAIEMQQQLRHFNFTYKNQHQSDVSIGIGIHKGDILLSKESEDVPLKTSLIGDAVNVTAQLEFLTKELQVPILITEKLFAALSQPECFTIHKLDNINIKCEGDDMNVYQVLVS